MPVPNPTFNEAVASDVVLSLGGWKKLPQFATKAQLRKAMHGLAPFAKAMTPTPTGAVSAANAASTITGAVQISPNNAAFKYRCATWNSTQGWGYYATANNAGSQWDWQGYGEIEFYWYGQKIDFRMVPTSPSGRMRVRVNGDYISLSAQPLTANDGNTYNVNYDFGSAGLRHIVVELCSAGFNGINVEPTSIIWPAKQPRAIRALWLGDSYTALANAVETVTNGAPLEACRRLGWDEPWLCAESGTGYLNTGASTGGPGRKKFRDRLAADVYPVAPDVIVVWGSINDANGSFSAAQIQAEAETLYSEILTNAPVGQAGFKPRLIAIGPQFPSGSPGQALIDTNTGVKTACQNIGVPFIDCQGWVLGTGRAGATTGSGNGDWAIASDSIHPTDNGHIYFGRRIATEIAALDLAAIG